MSDDTAVSRRIKDVGRRTQVLFYLFQPIVTDLVSTTMPVIGEMEGGCR